MNANVEPGEWHRDPDEGPLLVSPDGKSTYWWKHIPQMNHDHRAAAAAGLLLAALRPAWGYIHAVHSEQDFAKCQHPMCCDIRAAIAAAEAAGVVPQ